MAYAALGVAFIGLVMMFAGVIYESNWRAMDCDDNDWLAQNGYSSSSSSVEASDVEKCETDRAETYDTAVVLSEQWWLRGHAASASKSNRRGPRDAHCLLYRGLRGIVKARVAFSSWEGKRG